MKISNYNSISTIIDRLIIEVVKKNQFTDSVKLELQDRLIKALSDEFDSTLEDIMENRNYESIKEERTFK